MKRDELNAWLAKVNKTVDRKIVKAIYVYTSGKKMVKVWDCTC